MGASKGLGAFGIGPSRGDLGVPSPLREREPRCCPSFLSSRGRRGYRRKAAYSCLLAPPQALPRPLAHQRVGNFFLSNTVRQITKRASTRHCWEWERRTVSSRGAGFHDQQMRRTTAKATYPPPRPPAGKATNTDAAYGCALLAMQGLRSKGTATATAAPTSSQKSAKSGT